MVHLPQIPADALGFIVWVVGLAILWVIISVPVYFAGRAVTGGRSDFGDAMRATLLGAIVFFIVFFVVAFFLGAVLGGTAGTFATILAVLAWLGVYKSSFDTGWWGAVGIVLLAWVILLVLDFFLVLAVGVAFPNFYPF